MTDFHVITPRAVELVMRVVDGQLVIVPPAAAAAAPAGAPEAGPEPEPGDGWQQD